MSSFVNNTSQITPVLGSPTPVLGMKVKQGKSVIGLFLKINLSTAMRKKRFRRELSSDIVIPTGVFKK